MKIIVVSDIHSNHTALSRVLGDAGDFDTVLCSGDVVGYGPDPNECVEELMRLPARCIAGNHDRAASTGDPSRLNRYAAEAISINRELLRPRALQWLRGLPTHLKMEAEGRRIAVFHGSPDDPTWEYVYPTEAAERAEGYFIRTGADIIAHGHTHIPFVLRKGRVVFLNPGSVGQPRDGDPRASYAILKIEGGEVEARINRVEYDVEEVASRIRDLGIPDFLASRLSRGL
jgi:putative phosphoesterase